MPRLIDLFSGAGGLTLGFKLAFMDDLEIVWANDSDRDAVATYNQNFGPHGIFGDLTKLLEDPEVEIPQADIVIGGPPCQGFSLLNKNREQDIRKSLWQQFMNVVELSHADIFVIENVPQLLDNPEREEIVDRATRLGFFVTFGKLCSADYGVPQIRWRAFIIGCRFAHPATVFPPEPTHSKPGYLFGAHLPLWRTVRNAIEDLPPPVGTEVGVVPAPLNLHFGRQPTPLSLRRYQAIPEEGMNRFDLQRIAPEITPPCWIKKTQGGTDLFGRLWWDRPSVTIRTEFFKPEKGRYLHPVQDRPITHREAARFQSFPDEFQFVGSKISIAKQIGNAVPPIFASRVAECIKSLLINHQNQIENREQQEQNEVIHEVERVGIEELV